jgi:hypothetical protein
MTQRKSEKATTEVYQCEKIAENLDVSKLGKTGFVAPKEEVGGRGLWKWIACPHCGSYQHVYFDYEGEEFICDNCGMGAAVHI